MSSGIGVSWGPLWWSRPFGGYRTQQRELTFWRFILYVLLSPIFIMVFALWLAWLPIGILIRLIVWAVRRPVR